MKKINQQPLIDYLKFSPFYPRVLCLFEIIFCIAGQGKSQKNKSKMPATMSLWSRLAIGYHNLCNGGSPERGLEYLNQSRKNCCKLCELISAIKPYKQDCWCWWQWWRPSAWPWWSSTRTRRKSWPRFDSPFSFNLEWIFPKL